MFVFNEDVTFWSKVRIYVPGDGRKTVNEIEVQYRAISPEAVTEFSATALRLRSAGEIADDGAMLLKETVIGWKGIQDGGSGEFPFSDENLSKLIAIPYVRSAMTEGYFEGINGKPRKD